MYTLVVIIHIMICLVLCLVVLLQSSKGGGLAGAFGGSGGAPQQILGTRGMTTLLHKITIYCAAAFFVTSFTLFVMTGDRVAARTGSIVNEAAREGTLTSEVTPTLPAADQPFALPPADASGDDAAAGAASGDESSSSQSSGGQESGGGNESEGDGN